MHKYTFPDSFQAYQLHNSYSFINELGTLIEFIVKFLASQLALFAAIYDGIYSPDTQKYLTPHLHSQHFHTLRLALQEKNGQFDLQKWKKMNLLFYFLCCH